MFLIACQDRIGIHSYTTKTVFLIYLVCYLYNQPAVGEPIECM